MNRFARISLTLCALAASFGCGDTPDLDVDEGHAGTLAQQVDAPASRPGTFKVFDRIPQFGMYAEKDPDNYQPPAGMLMWNVGTLFAAKLSDAQKAQIGSDVKARLTYHAQCDNYDRIGNLFMVVVPKGQAPTASTPRTELLRIITPFSSYQRGALATFTYPLVDLSTYARTLSDPEKDAWLVIGGGSNPHANDPCARANRPAAFRAIGYFYSLELVSTQPLTQGPSVTLTALSNHQAKSTPITATLTAPAGGLTGRVTVIVSGHGAEAGGNEYMNTRDTLTVNGQTVGSFSTAVDCASLARFSPEGNPGIFQRNTSSNPRNWCPASIVQPRTFPVTLKPGANTVSLAINPGRVPNGSYYATSISFSAP
ncbi:MAG: peptide-N-glycosidase F-related protein [Polyangiales bacterium]